MEYPRGLVVRAEHQWSHREFVEAVQPEAVIVDLIDARQLAKRDMTGADYFGDAPRIITTSTIPDDKLDLMSWERERDIVRDFDSDMHVPTDYSLYGGQRQGERLELVSEMMEGARWMQDELSDTIVLPQVKGFTPAERRVCYREMAAHFDGYGMFYAAQYFGGESGNRINDLVDDLQQIREEWGGDLLVLGLLAPDYLDRLPDNVVAAAGTHRWRQRVTPRDSSAAEMREAYTGLEERVENALEV